MPVIKLKNRIIEINNCLPKDYRYCYDLTKRNMLSFYKAHQLEWKPESYRRNFDLKSVKILKYNQKRIGFYKLFFKENNWHLADLQISKLYRGQGIGTKVLELIARIIKKKGGKEITLKVFIDNPSVNLYKRVGFKKFQHNKKEGYYIMKKFLV